MRHTERETRGTLEVIRWARSEFGPGLVMPSAFGMNGVVLLHLVAEALGRGNLPPIVFVDTGYHFDETLATVEGRAHEYKLDLRVVRPHLSREEFEVLWGDDLAQRNPDLCCALRKVAPMRRALAQLRPRALLTARSRFQTDERASLQIVEWSSRPLRVNPLAAWTWEEIKGYAEYHELVVNPLHYDGYPSIGCWPCTDPVVEGEDYRAGRWRGREKTECGLWAVEDRMKEGQVKIGKFNLIDDGVQFGDGVEVGHFCIIEAGCHIGDNTRIRNYVELRKNTRIGANCYIDSGVKTSGDCTVGDGVTLRYDAIIARQVTVEEGAFIAPQVMTIYSTHEGEARPGIVIGAESFIGTGAKIGTGVQIAPGTTVGAGAVVTKDIAKPGIYVGMPARRLILREPAQDGGPCCCEEGGGCECAEDC